MLKKSIKKLSAITSNKIYRVKNPATIKTVAMRPVILSDYKCNAFVAMEIKIFDEYKSNAHRLYDGWEKYILVQCESDIARLFNMTHQEYKNIGLKCGGFEDDHNLLTFPGRNSANKLACILWSRQLPPFHINIKFKHKNKNHVDLYKLIPKIAEARKPFDR